MRTPQTSRLCRVRRLFAIVVPLSPLSGRALGAGRGRLLGLLLGRGRGLLAGVDLEGGLEGGVGEVDVGVGRQDVCHGRGRWPSRTTRGRLSTMLSAPAPLLESKTRLPASHMPAIAPAALLPPLPTSPPPPR